jgi:hypothetical protein
MLTLNILNIALISKEFQQVTEYLETAGNDLDYRRYSDQFFDILVAGGMLGKLQHYSS